MHPNFKKIITLVAVAAVAIPVLGRMVFKQTSSSAPAVRALTPAAPEPHPVEVAKADSTKVEAADEPALATPAPTPKASPNATKKVKTPKVKAPQQNNGANVASNGGGSNSGGGSGGGAGKPPKEPLHDPVAREALSYVGANPDANAYWLDAIFDNSLPDSEREDLMEDLNEEGLSDPKNPGPDDLPLIMNRLSMLESLQDQADDFMLPHLWEAYKDLSNLADMAQGGGEPVQ